jgi:hypothetical protein
VKEETALTSGSRSVSELNITKSGKQVKEKYLWLLTAIILVITLVSTVYLFQPYIKQYPDSYLRIYTIIGTIFLLLLVPVVCIFVCGGVRSKYLFVYIIALVIPIGYLFDIVALFFIPWILELIFSTLITKGGGNELTQKTL